MTLTLVKGERLNLTKETGGTADIFIIGLGWSPNAPGGADFDLDASAIMTDGSLLSATGSKVSGGIFDTQEPVSGPSFCYFGALSPNDSTSGHSRTLTGIYHSADDLTGGSSDGADDEQIILDLAALDSRVTAIDIIVTIYDAKNRKQHFGMVNDAYIRIGTGTRQSNGQPPAADGSAVMTEIQLPNGKTAKFDLTEDYSADTAMRMGTLYKKDGEWRFQALGEGFGESEIGDVFNLYKPTQLITH